MSVAGLKKQFYKASQVRKEVLLLKEGIFVLSLHSVWFFMHLSKAEKLVIICRLGLSRNG